MATEAYKVYDKTQDVSEKSVSVATKAILDALSLFKPHVSHTAMESALKQIAKSSLPVSASFNIETFTAKTYSISLCSGSTEILLYVGSKSIELSLRKNGVLSEVLSSTGKRPYGIRHEEF